MPEIRKAEVEHPPGLTRKPDYTEDSFFPKEFKELYNPRTCHVNYKEAQQKINHILTYFQPVYFKIFLVQGEAGTGKTTYTKAFASCLQIALTAKKNESVRNAHDRIQSYHLEKPCTFYKLLGMKSPQPQGHFYKDPKTIKSFAEAHLYAVLMEMANHFKHLEETQALCETMKSYIIGKWNTTTKAYKKMREEEGNTAQKRKRCGMDPYYEEALNIKENEKGKTHPEWTNLADVFNGNSNTVEMLCTILKSDIIQLIKSNIVVMDEAGMVNWYWPYLVMNIHQYLRHYILGLDRDIYPVLILLGSDSQSTAIRTDHNSSFPKKIADVSILEHALQPFVKSVTGLDKQNRVFMLYKNKRNNIEKFAKPLRQINLGIKDFKSLKVFDEHVIPAEYVLDPYVELQRSKELGDEYRNVLWKSPIDINKVDLRDYVRIFAGAESVEEYYRRCFQILPHKLLRTNIFVNVHEIEEYFKNIHEDSYKSTKHFLEKTECLGIDGKLPKDTLQDPDGPFELENEYWPSLSCPYREMNHIRYPLFDRHWEEGVEVANKKQKLDLEEYPKIPQTYQLYYCDSGILLGKPGRIVRKTKFKITGYRGNIKTFIENTIEYLDDTFHKKSPSFIILIIRQVYDIIKQIYYDKTKERITIQKYSEIKRKGILNQFTHVYEDYKYKPCVDITVDEDWEFYDMKHGSPRESQIVGALYDLKQLYQIVTAKHPSIGQHFISVTANGKDLTNPEINDINDLKLNHFLHGDVEANTPVTMCNVVDIPLNGKLVDAELMWRQVSNVLFRGYPNKSNSLKCQGVVVELRENGLVGIVLPESYEYNTNTNNQSGNTFCLLSAIGVPIISTVATTITKVQGQNIPNVALVVTPGMLHSQKTPFVGFTRHTMNFVTTANAFYGVTFIPQEGTLSLMLSPKTYHAL